MPHAHGYYGHFYGGPAGQMGPSEDAQVDQSESESELEPVTSGKRPDRSELSLAEEMRERQILDQQREIELL